MKRIGNLFPSVADWANLQRAAKAARAGKGNRPIVQRFEFKREWELIRLLDQLRDGTYRPGHYTTHRITRPKERLISAAPYRDRVVHHAVIGVLEPHLDRFFHPDSFACRTGKGTHCASRRLQHAMRRNAFACHADIRQFFPSIDHANLKECFRRRIKDKKMLELLDILVDGSNEQDETDAIFPGDDLFTSVERKRGMPIGNLTSQWFANWFLTDFDHYLTSGLGVGGYVRYCDDFVLLDNDPGKLKEILAKAEEKLLGLRLRLHPHRKSIGPVTAGITFVGYQTWPWRRKVRGVKVREFWKRIRKMKKLLEAGRLSQTAFDQAIAGWVGHASQADDQTLVRRILEFQKNSALRCAEENQEIQG